MGHAQAALKMIAMIRLGLLAINTVTRSAGAVPIGIASLGHEVLKDTMKLQAVVKLFLDETDEVTDGIGRFVFEELDHDHALVRRQPDARQVVGFCLSVPNLLFLCPEILVLLDG